MQCFGCGERRFMRSRRNRKPHRVDGVRRQTTTPRTIEFGRSRPRGPRPISVACNKANAFRPEIRILTMHCLRQTAASQMVAGGTPIHDVAKILAHRNVKTPTHYAHFAPEAGRAAAVTLEKMLDLDREEPETDAVHDREVLDRIG